MHDSRCVQGLTRNQNPADPLAITYLLQLLPRPTTGSTRHRMPSMPSLPQSGEDPPLAPRGARAAWRACLPCLSTRTLDERSAADKQSVVYTGAMAELPPIKEGALATQLPAHTAAIAASVVSAEIGLQVARTALRRQQHAEQERCVEAAATGDAAGVAQALARGAAGDREDRAGRTPIAVAATLGHTEVLAKLLAQRDKQGYPTTDLTKCVLPCCLLYIWAHMQAFGHMHAGVCIGCSKRASI